jgi:TolA-binding protein
MSKILALLISIPIVLFAAEPSVYGAGNLNSANPYGLSPSEKKIVQNSKDIKNLQKKINSIKLKYNDLRDRLDGVRSVVESISNKIGKIGNKNFAQKEKNSNFEDEIAQLKKSIDDSAQLQNENQDKVKNVLSELSSLIDSINTNYLPKEKFEELQKKQQDFQIRVENMFKQLKSEKRKSSISSKSGSVLLKEAYKFFKKKSYDEAQIRFSRLVKINYKPATSNYMLGEISYRRKNYKKAIAYYKKSISLYDKASFTPTLLYHTGISLSKLKKSAEARNFFTALKTNYPNSKEAKALKK